ncbi:MAG: class I SAM-dependent methyltransferase [Lachnospiraceae bacterium]|nr:class I SAM-dependent methyltransferase [Lachnospiraceae bacterium]
MKDIEIVQQAKESFNRIIDNKTYANIIKDDNHLLEIMDLIEESNYRRILDIGTGTGYLAFPLAERFPKSTVCGIDIADAIIQKNNEIVKEKGITNLSFEVFDGLNYLFEDESGTVWVKHIDVGNTVYMKA